MQPLPPAISGFYQSEQSTDAAELTACFAADALVHDENKAYRGIDAILAWRLDTQRKTPFVSRPMSVQDSDGDYLVTAEISGSFPGSPVILEHRFTLVQDRIASLEIV